jgi:hypothetical protein
MNIMTNLLTNHVDELLRKYVADNHLTPSDDYDGDVEADFNDILDAHELPEDQWADAVNEYIGSRTDPDGESDHIAHYATMLNEDDALHALYAAAEVMYASTAYDAIVNE